MSLVWTRGSPRWVTLLRISTATILALAVALIVRGVVFAQADPSGEATIAADPSAGVTFVWTLMAGALSFLCRQDLLFWVPA